MKPSTAANPAPGFRKRPDYRLGTRPAGVRVRVTSQGELLADSRDALVLEEGAYPPVYYVPRKDARMERLARSEHRSYCPFKGHAAYFSVIGGPQDAVWSYEQPYDEMRAIGELLAFYPDKVEITASGG